MFDRNTVIAFVLIVVIFIVWQLWWVKTPSRNRSPAVDSLSLTRCTNTLGRAIAKPADSTKIATIDTTAAAVSDTIPETAD